VSAARVQGLKNVVVSVLKSISFFSITNMPNAVCWRWFSNCLNVTMKTRWQLSYCYSSNSILIWSGDSCFGGCYGIRTTDTRTTAT